MSRVALILFVVCGGALAHPGHGEPEPHFHFAPIVVLAVVAVVCVVFRWRTLRRRQ